MITVFTPTYNRAHTLPFLYKSLLDQTNKNFEWVIVNDGSTDNTTQVVEQFINESVINIVYLEQINGGKHRAINKGVSMARGDVFFIVDSDDTLTFDAIAWAEERFEEIKAVDTIAGFSGMRATNDGHYISKGRILDYVDATKNEVTDKYNLHGDFAEMYKLSVLKEYPFPDFPNEKFCSEGVVWARILQKYKVRYYNKIIYHCEYLADGLTKNKNKCRIDSPNYSMLLYSEQILYQNRLLLRMKNAINYWRFSGKSKKSFVSKAKTVGLFATVFAPIGIFWFYIMSFQLRHENHT